MIIKLFKNKLLIVLEIIGGLSFTFSIIMIYINPNYSFYFPLSRLWEMTVGAILAYLNFNSENFKINSHISTLAIIAILVNSFLMNDVSLFPGFWALIPVLGTACIIQNQN
jgi:peptidoglycan/LPS O-acetylase OafA/YrhL